MLQHYSKLLFLISIILLCVTVYVSFIVGTIPISLKDILTQFTTGHVSNVDTIIDLRLPRIIIALCVGAMLSVSGALLQAVLQNPLADAQLLGVSSGALVMRMILLLVTPQLFLSYLYLVSRRNDTFSIIISLKCEIQISTDTYDINRCSNVCNANRST